MYISFPVTCLIHVKLILWFYGMKKMNPHLDGILVFSIVTISSDYSTWISNFSDQSLNKCFEFLSLAFLIFIFYLG